jgi:hypothetical protein
MNEMNLIYIFTDYKDIFDIISYVRQAYSLRLYKWIFHLTFEIKSLNAKPDFSFV